MHNISSVIDYNVLNELRKNGWSYPLRGSGSSSDSGSSGNGLYCWEKYRVLSDGTKEFVGFVAEDNKDSYPDGGTVGGYFYQRCFEEGQSIYMLVTNEDETYAQLVGKETVNLTATTNDIRLGATAVVDKGVVTGEKDIPAYRTTQAIRAIKSNQTFEITFDDDRYDYTKLQAMTAPFNTTLEDSVAVDGVAIDDVVYKPGTTEAISFVTKNAANKSISLGYKNGSVPHVIRYFTYREEI